jgi:flavin reductase (DIM6/NTAB) family NADH-FMN oxidoreductase RutF
MPGRNESNVIPTELLEYLQGGHVAVLVTIDPSGLPDLSLVTWVLAINERIVRFVVGANNRTAGNLFDNGRVAFQFLGPKIAYAIKGTARLIKKRVEAISFPESMFEMAVEEVYENRFGTTHVGGPIQIIREDKIEKLAAEVGARVCAEMRAFREMNQ